MVSMARFLKIIDIKGQRIISARNQPNARLEKRIDQDRFGVTSLCIRMPARRFPPPWSVEEMPARRFPPPWSVEELDACFDAALSKVDTRTACFVHVVHRMHGVAMARGAADCGQYRQAAGTHLQNWTDSQIIRLNDH
jgi:hypothetical protein